MKEAEQVYQVTKKKTTEVVFRGDRLRKLREQAKLTQSELADALATETDPVGQKYISRWETSLFNPDLPMVIRIAHFFGVTIDYMVGESDDPQSRSAIWHQNTAESLATSAVESGKFEPFRKPGKANT